MHLWKWRCHFKLCWACIQPHSLKTIKLRQTIRLPGDKCRATENQNEHDPFIQRRSIILFFLIFNIFFIQKFNINVIIQLFWCQSRHTRLMGYRSTWQQKWRPRCTTPSHRRRGSWLNRRTRPSPTQIHNRILIISRRRIYRQIIIRWISSRCHPRIWWRDRESWRLISRNDWMFQDIIPIFSLLGCDIDYIWLIKNILKFLSILINIQSLIRKVKIIVHRKYIIRCRRSERRNLLILIRQPILKAQIIWLLR